MRHYRRGEPQDFIDLTLPLYQSDTNTSLKSPSIMSQPAAGSPANSGPPAKRPRGRRPGIQVPCDACIARASQNTDKGGELQLCGRCTAALKRPKARNETAGIRRRQRQSWSADITALGPQSNGVELAQTDSRHEQQAHLPGAESNAFSKVATVHAHPQAPFASLHEARAELEIVANQSLAYFVELELDDERYNMAVGSVENQVSFRPWLQSWESAFNAFLQLHQGTMVHAERKSAMVLKAQHLVCVFLSNIDLSEGVLAWFAFHQEFRAIIDLATAVLEENGQDHSPIDGNKSGSELASIPDIISSLCEVCARCPDPSLRAQALDLVSRHWKQEWTSMSTSAWKVSTFMLRHEEPGEDSTSVMLTETSAEPRVARSWSGLADQWNPGEPGVTDRQKVLPATPRYVLNPGLFEIGHQE
ncbi:hypothetical protein EJ03DRAFT_66168 [Teratosphaeria nubilosa]|uniref:Uncharacterized protein n=1 Tax=Teratosphaeria nubilosa TaxID=161662 RepID=A0A6G1LD35_9PEZI|nr:hypothetical protein EJ03DRAFT_66168 [Teratosphaeria nubilosa]